MDLFFYVVIVIIVILKVIFWVFYFYSRYKRKELRRLISAQPSADIRQGCYEEQPTVPQPAFMFSPEGCPRGAYPLALPAYAVEDPGKIEGAPPPYIHQGEEVHPIVLSCDSPEQDGDTIPLLVSEPQSPT